MLLDYVLGDPVCEKRGGCEVRLADSVQKCVVFLGPEQGDDIVLAGTGFLVSKAQPEAAVYLITAAHVARETIGPIGVRLNTREGLFRVQALEHPEWVYHRDPNVDVAALLFEIPPWADARPFALGKFATNFKMATKNLGPGDFAYVVGLYRLLKDTRRNIPLVHTGHIAATALDHPIPVGDSVGGTIPTRAYLVESRAISGASGSPVFVRRSVDYTTREAADIPKSERLKVTTPGSVWLLGLWQASWPKKPDQTLIESAGIESGVTVSVGIGLVVPAPYIIDVLGQDDMRSQWMRWKNDRDLRVAATTDVAPSTTADNPQHKEDFNSLLRAAAQKRSQDDQT
jgi:hypothetical protein